MSTPLDRRPLDTVSDLTLFRQVKLGRAIDDARSLMPYYTDEETRAALAAAGYRGTVDQTLNVSSRFAVTIPDGTRGLVLTTGTESVNIVFVWKTPKSGKITAAVVRLVAPDLVNHRGAPPLPGEPAPAALAKAVHAAVAQEPAPAPSATINPAPIMTPAAAPAPAAGSLDAMLAAIVDARVGARIEALENELATRAAGPSVVHVKVNDRPAVTLSRRPHVRFPFVLKRVEMRKPDGGRFNLFLTGDAGTGKSTIAAAVAEALDLPFHSLNCSGGLTEGALVGRMTPNLSTGEMTYTPGPLVQSYRDGGVFILDELDGADENVLLALNTIADAPRWHAPNGEVIERHPNHILLGAGNTYGTGASRIYSGRTQLDGAFLNRWLTVSVDYDTDLERSLCVTPEIVERIQSARAAIRSRGLRRWLTTRDILKADALVCQAGESVRDALLEITEGWTSEDRSVCGIV
jgi:cobaltochelatase CobS